MSKHFDTVAKDWDADDFKHQMSSSIADAIKRRILFAPDMHIMDFGAGTGLLSSNFYAEVAHITAVDISAAMLEQLKQKVHLQDKLTICCQDIINTPLKEEYDVIMSAMAVHHIEDTEKLFKTLYQNLKLGGSIAIADLDSEDGSFHPSSMEGIHHYGFDRDHIKSILEKAGFVHINFDTAFLIAKEGKEYPIFLATAKKA